MFGLGIGELVVIGLFALLFIGPKKLPELAKGLGKGIREFQRAKDEIVKTVKDPDYGTEPETTKHIASGEENDSLDNMTLSEVKKPQQATIARGEFNMPQESQDDKISEKEISKNS